MPDTLTDETLNKKPISVTDAAARKLGELFAGESEEKNGLKVGVRGGGCSGLSYVLDLTKEPGEEDKVFDSNGIRIFLDLKSFLYLRGTELDFSEGLNGKGFTFSNPNAARTCGCGQSFGV